MQGGVFASIVSGIRVLTVYTIYDTVNGAAFDLEVLQSIVFDRLIVDVDLDFDFHYYGSFPYDDYVKMIYN